ncbi:MAG TPA: hypothetical protein VKU00_07495 [Chthonomonadaceae bacterium]|nr:hypothetical protein [Chthonomonadaceae bacterium]
MTDGPKRPVRFSTPICWGLRLLTAAWIVGLVAHLYHSGGLTGLTLLALAGFLILCRLELG